MRRWIALAAPRLLGATDPTPAPKLGRTLFTGADPSALADDGQLWLYPTGEGDRLHAWASSDLSHWQHRATLLRLKDVRWARDGERHYLWAPHMTAANGGYYL